MSALQEVLKLALSRSKICKIMYEKLIKEKGPNQDLYLVYASYLVEEGKIGESLDVFHYTIKNIATHMSCEKILPLVEKIIEFLKRETNFSLVSSRDPFSCPACRGLLYEPVTIICGHTYCKNCITRDTVCTACDTSATTDLACSTNVLITSLVEKWWLKDLQGVVLRNKGNKHFKDKQVYDAIELYTEAVQYAPNDHLLLMKRSHALHIIGRDEEALQDANRAIQLRPDWSKGHYRRSKALLALGREEDALVAMMICVVLENSTDNVRLYEICKMLLVIMRRHTYKSCDVSPYVSSFEGKRCFRGGITEEREIVSKKHRPGATFGGHFVVEEAPVVTKVLNKLASEFRQIKDCNTGYVRTVDPRSVQSSDFECPLCYLYLWQPVTTPCGHTFCRSCLDRSLDHAIHCPLCKTSLRDFLAENRSSINEFMDHAMKLLIPKEYSARGHQHQLEISEFAKAGKDSQHEIPIFVATLAIPSISCPLHVFEPRYRLMIRRVMEAGTKEFGMCMPSDSEERGYSNYGTMLKVREVKHINDGRRIVNAVGSQRFKCVSKGIKDGYNTATVEYLKDEEVSEENLAELKVLHDSVNQKASYWFSSIEQETKRRILSHYGNIPPVEDEYWALPDGPVWIWWLIAILPLEPCMQMRIIKERSLKYRLNFVSQILRCVLIYQNRPE